MTADTPRPADASGTNAAATPTAPIVVRKLGYPTQVRVVDGVPQCPCHQEPMVQRGDEWMHPSDATAVELMALGARRIDEWLNAQPPAGDDQEETRRG